MMRVKKNSEKMKLKTNKTQKIFVANLPSYKTQTHTLELYRLINK